MPPIPAVTSRRWGKPLEWLGRAQAGPSLRVTDSPRALTGLGAEMNRNGEPPKYLAFLLKSHDLGRKLFTQDFVAFLHCLSLKLSAWLSPGSEKGVPSGPYYGSKLPHELSLRGEATLITWPDLSGFHRGPGELLITQVRENGRDKLHGRGHVPRGLEMAAFSLPSCHP